MARLSTVSIEAPDTRLINLTVLLVRLHDQLITSDAKTEHNLRTSQRERDRVRKNLEYARVLLLKLEQDVQDIRVQSRRQKVQMDLVKKREEITNLVERLDEIAELAEDPEDDSEGEDLLGEDTPSEDTQSLASPTEATPTSSLSRDETTPSPRGSFSNSEHLSVPTLQPAPVPLATPNSDPVPPPPATQPDTTSTLRQRHKAERAELLTPAAITTGISTANTEALLTHHRTEQEDLTKSLLEMARMLKDSSHKFNASLEEEKDVLNNAAKGLDKSELGLEAAQRRMGYLRTMTEGRGWIGRMMMYGWIAGLMVIAILVVFVMPKLRF